MEDQMADVMVRRGGGQGSGTDPLQMMREPLRRILGIDPYNMFQVDPFLDLVQPALAAATTFSPDFEVRDTGDGLVIEADVPGVRDEDLEITATGNQIRISGKREVRREDQGDTW